MDDLYKKINNYVPYDEKEEIEKQVILDFMDNNDDVLSRKNKIAHFTTSAWIVNNSHNKVLMIHHNIYNSWAWIGGHADEDSDLFHVVNKEIEEETGLTNLKPLYDGIYGINILTVENHFKRSNYVNSHLHFDVEFLFEADENLKTRIKEDENSGVSWINFDEIDKKVNEEKMKPIYHKLIKKMELIKK